MITADKIIKEIYLLPLEDREKVVRYIIHFGIKTYPSETPEILNLKEWQDEIAQKPFNLKQASDYLGVSSVTLRRWIKKGRISAYKTGRAYTFDVKNLKEFKKNHTTRN